MIELTTHLQLTAPDLDSVFRSAIDSALAGIKPTADYDVVATVRGRHGFLPVAREILSWDNHKLLGAKVKSGGLTLFHFRSVLPAVDGHQKLSLNACPNAGHCVKVCVLNNGNGRYDTVQRAWLWRTDLLARHPESFARVLAWELVKAVRRYGRILFRPNINSDVAWQLILPSLVNGYLPGVLSYGYSKRPETLASDGWLGTAYRVAYSWNETSNRDDVRAFIMRGGAVAVVSSRRKGDSVGSVYPFGTTAMAVDADVSDEWMLTGRGVVGDLSAKGKACQLIGRSAFVVSV